MLTVCENVFCAFPKLMSHASSWFAETVQRLSLADFKRKDVRNER